jgi:hypothetical protein
MKLLGLKVPKFLEKVLTNKYVLYLMVFVSIVYILGFLHIQSWDNLGLFVVVGLLTTYFTKNMVIVLAMSILIANCNVCKDIAIKRLPKLFGIHEGFDSKEGATGDDDDDDDDNDDNDDSSGSFYEMKEDGKTCGDKPVKECKSVDNCFTDSSCKSKKESMKSKDVPSSRPARVDGGDDDAPEGGKERIDYAKTLEMAYDNLDKMLGKDGMAGLTAETTKLATQQKNLMESLNTMQPMIAKAKSMMEGMDLPDVGNITETLSKFTKNNKK